MDLRDEALKLAELGYMVFPCRPLGKIPACAHGFLDATTDVNIIEAWWQLQPEFNVAIATHGLIVIDIDGISNPWLSDKPELALSLSAAPFSQTPGGGRHYIFRQPDGKEWGCTTSQIFQKVDTRGNGGYIVVPPSIADNGIMYEWKQPLECKASILPEPPEWLAEILDRIYQGQKAIRSLSGTSAIGNTIPDGQRNATLARLAGGMRRMGMGEPEIFSALRSANETRCSPPMPDSEVALIAKSICRYEPDQVATALAEDHWGQLSPEEKREVAITLPRGTDTFPLDLLKCGGLLERICTFTNLTSRRPQPVLSLGAAIALIGTVTGRKISDSFGTRTNIYCLGVAKSGAGKERARQINKELLTLAGAGRMAGPEGIGSHAGLISIVKEQPAILLQLDECETHGHTSGRKDLARQLGGVARRNQFLLRRNPLSEH